jgi:hypothetical protein
MRTLLSLRLFHLNPTPACSQTYCDSRPIKGQNAGLRTHAHFPPLRPLLGTRHIMARITKDRVPGNSGGLCELAQSLLRTTHEYVLAVGDAIGYSGSRV